MKKVVVIGCGFAGTTVAKKLDGKCDLTLIDAEDFFEYTPGILRTLVEPEHYRKLHVKHSEYLLKTKIIVGHVKEIKDKIIIMNNGKKINYDYLVIASGSSYNSPIKEQDIFFATRVKNLLESYKKIQKSKKIIVVGGGVVGVELASEIATHYPEIKITLVHSGSRLIERNDIKSSRCAEYFLNRKRVKIIFNEIIVNRGNKKLVGKSGAKYDYDSVFFTVGIKPNVEFMTGNMRKFVSKGIIVNEYLQIPQMKNVFVAGDVSNIVEEKTAQNAEYHGKVVAYNVLALINNLELKKYVPKKRLMVISLGKYSGIIEYGSFVMTGWIPALFKWMIEKMVMSKFLFKMW